MRKILLILVTIFALIGCDRVSKMQAVELLKGQDDVSLLGGFFTLAYYENKGAMLSLGANLPDDMRFYIFTVFVGIGLLIGLLYIVTKPLNNWNLVSGILIVSGGLGNLYDRAFNNGLVVDFMIVEIGPIKTGVFNVADIAIMAGLIGLVFVSVKTEQQQTKPS